MTSKREPREDPIIPGQHETVGRPVSELEQQKDADETGVG